MAAATPLERGRVHVGVTAGIDEADEAGLGPGRELVEERRPCEPADVPGIPRVRASDPRGLRERDIGQEHGKSRLESRASRGTSSTRSMVFARDEGDVAPAARRRVRASGPRRLRAEPPRRSGGCRLRRCGTGRRGAGRACPRPVPARGGRCPSRVEVVEPGERLPEKGAEHARPEVERRRERRDGVDCPSPMRRRDLTDPARDRRPPARSAERWRGSPV